MDIERDDYKLTYENGVIKITGKLSIMLEEYEGIEEFFEKIVKSQPAALTLDIRDLEYLNSSGIKTICVNLLLEADEIDDFRMKILCSKQYTWQEETIPTFEDLISNMEIIFE